MNVKKSILCFVLAIVGVIANAASISGNLTDDSARLNVSISAEPFIFEAGGVYASERGKSGYAGIMIESKAEPIEIGIGVRFRVVEGEFGDNDSGYSTGFGGYYRYIFPTANRFSFYLSGYYYPELFSYESIERQYEMESRIEYFSTENARLYISYNINAIDYVDMDDTFRLEEDVNLGVGVYF